MKKKEKGLDRRHEGQAWQHREIHWLVNRMDRRKEEYGKGKEAARETFLSSI